MIYALLGKPGEGKSFSASRLIREKLDQGVTVYSNIHVNDDRPHYHYFDTSNYEIIYKLHDGLVIFDEGQEILDSRNWMNLPLDFRLRVQKGRHDGLDILVVTQDINQIDVAYRRLVQEAQYTLCLFQARWANFAIFMLRSVDLTSIEKQKGEGWPSFAFGTKKDFEYYNSHAYRTPPTDLGPYTKLCTLCGLHHELEKKPIKDVLTPLIETSPEPILPLLEPVSGGAENRSRARGPYIAHPPELLDQAVGDMGARLSPAMPKEYILRVKHR